MLNQVYAGNKSGLMDRKWPYK